MIPFNFCFWQNAGVTPDPSSALIAAWYDSSVGTWIQPTNPSNGSSVAQWNDRSTFGNHNLAPQGGANKPTYNTNTKNGLSSLSFTASNNLNVGSFNSIAGQSGITGFIVCKFSKTTVPQTVTSNDFRGLYLGITGSTPRFQIGSAAGIGEDSTSTVDTNWHIHVLKFDGTKTGNANRLIYRRDKIPQTLNFGSTASFGATTVGTQSNPAGTLLYVASFKTSEYFNGNIGEIIVYSSALSDLQIQQTEAYLSQKWAI